MNTANYRLTQDMLILVAVFLCSIGTRLDAQDVHTQVDGDAHAKGVAILRLTFPTQGEVWRVRLTTSEDGEEFREAGFGVLGIPDVFLSITYHEGGTTILIPSVGWYDRGRLGISFYDEPGPYWVRWGVPFRNQDKSRTVPDQRDKNIRGVVADQVVEVAPPTRADLSFIAGLADHKLMRSMFGEDFFERQTGNAIEYYAEPEVRAVMVIGRLLYATRDHWVGDIMRQAGPKGDRRKAGELLLALAKKNPDSSYAPYAAYYAGCCYWAVCFAEVEDAIRAHNREGELQDDLELGKYRAAFITKDQGAARACEAFTLAARRADDYLKPRVLYQHAFLRLTAFDFDEAERLLVKGAEVLPGEGTVQEWIEKARKGLEALKAKLDDAADNEAD